MKKSIIIITSVLIAFFTSSCYDSKEVDEMVYILAIGIDEAENGFFEYTFQTAVPLNISSGVETSFSSAEKSVSLNNINVIAKDLYSAVNTANQSISKELNIAHCKLVIFSEKVAKKTIEPHMKSVINNPDLRPSTYVAIAKDTAKSYLDSISSPFELNPARYYELLFGKDYSPETFLANLRDFENQPSVAVPLIGNNNKFSTSVFSNFCEIGTLSDEETIFLNILSGRFTSGYITIFDDISPVNLNLNKKPKIVVDTKNIPVKINFHLDFYGTPLSLIKDKKKFDENMLRHIKTSCEKLLYKTATELNADVLDIASYAKKEFLTTVDFESYEWHKKYKEAEFNVIVNYKTIR